MHKREGGNQEERDDDASPRRPKNTGVEDAKHMKQMYIGSSAILSNQPWHGILPSSSAIEGNAHDATSLYRGSWLGSVQLL